MTRRSRWRRPIGCVARAARALSIAVVAARLFRVLRAASPLSPQAVGSSEPPVPSGTWISIVIPARDEADRLGPAIASVGGAPGVAEVIVVDDDSTDDTIGVARRGGAAIVSTGRPPAGWAGKTWALHQGVRRATGRWVVLLDADCRVDAMLPATMVARLESEGLDLLSVTGRVGATGSAETAVHAAMLVTLVSRFGPPGSRMRGRPMISGQCVAVRRRDVLEWGGWDPVASSTIEDVALARWLDDRGRRVGWLDASELLLVEPYGSTRATIRGWGRSIGLAGVESPTRRFVDLATFVLVFPTTWIRLASGRFGVLDGLVAALRLGVSFGVRRAYEQPSLGVWLSPLADPAAAAVLAGDLARRRETWRGRTVDRPRRR